MDILMNQGDLPFEDKLMIILHHLVEIPGIILSLFLLFLIGFSTPKWLKSYSILIANATLTDLVACLVNIFVMQRMIPIKLSLFYISYGYCTLFDDHFCYIGYCIMVCTMANGLYSLCIAFVYRYYVLLHSGRIGNRRLVLICIIVTIPSIFQAVTFSTVDDGADALKPLLTSILHYNLTNLTVSGHITILRFWTLYTIVFACGSTGAAYLIMFWCRRRVLSALAIMEMSPKTKIVHRDLIMALTTQSLLPLVIVICSSMYGIQQMNIVHSSTMEHLIFLIAAFNPVLSPIFSIYFVRPYREAALNLFQKVNPKLKRMNPRSISVTYSSSLK